MECLQSIEYRNKNEDSDGDGLLDGEEIEILAHPSGDGYYIYMYSDPCMIDTDGDTYDDGLESYIGLSSLSRQNIFSTQWYKSAFGRPVKINLKSDLNQLKWKGFIHNDVQDEIVKKYPDISKEVGIPGAGRCDLIRKKTGHIWEVKPSTVLYSDGEMKKPLDQLQGYVDNTIDGKRGDLYIVDGVIDDDKHDYYIEYYNMGEGIILYYFEKKKDYDRRKAVEIISQFGDDDNDADIKYTQVIDLEQKAKDVAAIILLGIILGDDIPSGGTLSFDNALMIPLIEYLLSQG